MSKKVEEKPFKALFSKEQLEYIKGIKADLLDYLNEPIDEDNYDQSAKQHLLIEGLFKLPVMKQNIYLIRVYGQFNSVTLIADEIHITKQTLCKVVRDIKTYLLKYVNSHYKPYFN